MATKRKHSKKEVNLKVNIKLCFESGFGALIAINDEDDDSRGKYRVAIVSIHAGIELLMKYYLEKKDKLLIIENIDENVLLQNRDDLIQNINKKPIKTISFTKCRALLSYFSSLEGKNSKYLKELNNCRNSCVHHEFWYYENKIRKLLFSHIYQFICDLIEEMGLETNEFIPESQKESLDIFKNTIDHEIEHLCHLKIVGAKNHYDHELTDVERKQKKDNEDYAKKDIDLIVECPACKNNALLERKLQINIEDTPTYRTVIRNVILKKLSCHYCALNIYDYDILKLLFDDKEKKLNDLTISTQRLYSTDCPEDCADWDCQDDCADCSDCQDDCADCSDCQDDCADCADCQDDCADCSDCQDDCADCPEDCSIFD